MKKTFIFLLLLVLCTFSVSAALTDGLQAYYSMDDIQTSGTVLFDSYPETPINGTLSDAAIAGFTGKNNQAYNFTNDKVTLNLGATSGVDLLNSFTIAGWVYFTNIANQQPIICTDDTGSHKIQYCFMLLSGTVGLYLSDSGSTATPSATIAYSLDDSYHFVVGTFDDTSNIISVWLDGTRGTNGTMASAHYDAAANTLIGMRTNAAHDYEGPIDEIMIWNRVLTDPELTQLYNGGSGLFYPFGANMVNVLAPTDGDHTNNDPLNITYNLTTSSSTNCSLIVDDVLNQTTTGLSSGVYYFLPSMAEGVHTYYTSCYDGSAEFADTNQTIVLDYTNPDFTLNPNNFL